MRYLKLFESFNREDVDSICKKYGIENYTINEDITIDVKGDVYFEELCLPNGYLISVYHKNRWIKIPLPLKFRNVSGNCSIMNNKLTTLKDSGCPISVGGNFRCVHNKLTSLEGGPKSVGVDFNCGDNNIRTFEGFPINLGGNFFCINNPVFVLWRLFEDEDKIDLFNDFGITDGEVVILERLNEFLEMIGKPILTNTNGLKKEGYKII